MRGLILAGGAGTRLRPITHTSAKQLVPVANKPILFYGLEAMAAAGISQIGIIVGDPRAEVMAAVGTGERWGVEITFLPQDAPLGLAHCVLIARDFLGDDDFVMYLGDNLLEQDLGAFVNGFEAARSAEPAPCAQILLKRVPDPQRFGIAELDGEGHVVRPVEKPLDPPRAPSRPTPGSLPPRLPTSPSSASTCSTAPSTTPSGPSSRPPGASSRSP